MMNSPTAKFLLCAFCMLTVRSQSTSRNQRSPSIPLTKTSGEQAALREKCKDAEKMFRRKLCYDAGHAVTFLTGGRYACCSNVTDIDLLMLGASAFWRKAGGFCGRGACDACSRAQLDCITYGETSIFCCSPGYTKI